MEQAIDVKGHWDRYGELLSVVSEGVSRFQPWNVIEGTVSSILSDGRAYLGGDALRPFVLWADTDQVALTDLADAEAMASPLVAHLRRVNAGFESARQTYSFAIGSPRGRQLASHLDAIPNVLLVGLGEKRNYQFVRLNLGIARLAQWLRFCGVARVEVIDFFLFPEPEAELKARLRGRSYDIIGISVNFGQWRQLEAIQRIISATSTGTKLVFGNILASFASERLSQLFKSSSFDICQSYGEAFLRKKCEEILASRGFQLDQPLSPLFHEYEVDDLAHIVFPDDQIVHQTLVSGGQVSLETSLGCQYGKCTFCPRHHRGDWWKRGNIDEVPSVLARYAEVSAASSQQRYVSFVDEEFFGDEPIEGSSGKSEEPAAYKILDKCKELDTSFEIYTRVDNIFCRKKPLRWNMSRLMKLRSVRHLARRVFCGVESGSPGQLKRYGKGQSVSEILDTIRAASMVGIALEFGFITFDPLMTFDELVENVLFLSRDDAFAVQSDDAEIADAIEAFYRSGEFRSRAVPLYEKVAYLSTELEVLANSTYAKMIFNKRRDLYSGQFDANFARYKFDYADLKVKMVLDVMRYWTNEMFSVVYRHRMIKRVERGPKSEGASRLVRRYQHATFTLLVTLTASLAEGKDLLLNVDTECLEVLGLHEYPATHKARQSLLKSLAGYVLRDVEGNSEMVLFGDLGRDGTERDF